MEWKGFFAIFFLIFIVKVNEVAGIRKCKKVVAMTSFGIGTYLGKVSFFAPENFKGNWKIYMTTDRPFSFIGGTGVRIHDFPEKGKIIIKSAQPVKVSKGKIISFDFRIRYAPRNQAPKVKEILWNDKQICSGWDDNGIHKYLNHL